MAIKTLIFDLGGVVLNLDQDRTLRAFRRLGADLDQLNDQTTLFTDFETGKIAASTFIDHLEIILKGEASRKQIADAWNAMLLDLPSQRVALLKELKKKYRLLLLSNTNSLHMDAVFEENSRTVFEEVFDKIYLSYEIGLRKPNTECYEYVLNDAGISAHESVFIDDSRANIRGAETAGIRSILAMQPVDQWLIKALKQIQPLQMI